jgi:hypothetical protein
VLVLVYASTVARMTILFEDVMLAGNSIGELPMSLWESHSKLLWGWKFGPLATATGTWRVACCWPCPGYGTGGGLSLSVDAQVDVVDLLLSFTNVSAYDNRVTGECGTAPLCARNHPRCMHLQPLHWFVCTASNNDKGGFAGGIAVDISADRNMANTSVLLNGMAVSGNTLYSSTAEVGGLSVAVSAGALLTSSSLVLRNVSCSFNVVGAYTSYSFSPGGGMSVAIGGAVMTNTTLAMVQCSAEGNSVGPSGGAGVYVAQGGSCASNCSVLLASLNLTNNMAFLPDSSATPGDGGGLSLAVGGNVSVTLSNVLATGNTACTCCVLWARVWDREAG